MGTAISGAQGRCGGRRGAAGGAGALRGAQPRCACGGRSHAAPVLAAGWRRGAAWGAGAAGGAGALRPYRRRGGAGALRGGQGLRGAQPRCARTGGGGRRGAAGGAGALRGAQPRCAHTGGGGRRGAAGGAGAAPGGCFVPYYSAAASRSTMRRNRSLSVMTPTTRSPSTTGTPPMRWRSRSCATAIIGSSGPTVITG